MRDKVLQCAAVVGASLALALSLAGCASDAGQSASESVDTGELGSVSVVAREEGSGTRSEFSETVGLIETDEDGTEVDVTTADATICNEASAVIEAVAADENAIGYVSLGALSEASGVKAIAVEGVEASTETVQDGSYALSRNFYIAYTGQSTEVEADFLDYITSVGQDIVTAEGYVAVSSSGRFLSDQSEGYITISGSTSVAPLMEALVEGYAAENANASISVIATDSTTGLNAAMSQESDWGMSSRDLATYESELLETTVIAQDAVAVIVNEASPIESLSLEQLRLLFSGEAAEWSDLN